jgi:molybdopterin-containing oxidoreductase family membrane subunit
MWRKSVAMPTSSSSGAGVAIASGVPARGMIVDGGRAEGAGRRSSVAGGSAAGGVVVAMYIFRTHYKLEKYITDDHFDRMGKVLVLLALLYLYFNFNEFLVPAFKMKKSEEEHLLGLFTGEFAPIFWFAIFTSMFIPIFILLFKKGRKPIPAFIAGILVVVGSWFKRFLIVTPTLLHPFLPMHDVPENYHHYIPSWEEWAIAGGSLAGALLVITFFARIFPIIPIHETIIETESLENEKRF